MTHRTPAPSPAASAVAQLCPQCGLCCDSTLFADVELRAGDAAARLQALGLELWQKTKTRLAFTQPCACFDGRLCRIYADRPRRCRGFECGLLKRVMAGRLTAAAALAKIRAVQARAGKIRELLRQAGQKEETMALTHRYAEAMSAPVDLAQEAAADQRGELMLAVQALMQAVERDFLT